MTATSSEAATKSDSAFAPGRRVVRRLLFKVLEHEFQVASKWEDRRASTRSGRALRSQGAGARQLSGTLAVQAIELSV